MGNIMTNTVNAMTVSKELDVKTSFIKDCGTESLKYFTLDPLGNFRIKWPLYVAISCLILGILLLIVSSNTIASTNTNTVTSANTTAPSKIIASANTNTNTNTIVPVQSEEKSTAKKIGTTIGWIFIIASLMAGTYNSILYLFFYLPQYYKWFDGLSADCKLSVGKIGMINALQAELRNDQSRQMNNYNYVSI